MARTLLLYLIGLTLRSLVLAIPTAIVCFATRNVVRKHALWTALLACIVFLPAVDALLPSMLVPERVAELATPVRTIMLPASVTTFPAAPPIAVLQPAAAAFDWWQIAGLIVVAITFISVLRLAMAYREVRWLRRSGRAISVPAWEDLSAARPFWFRITAIRECKATAVPLTVGFWRPVILLPAGWLGWEHWKLRAVLTHELAHIRRFDWAISFAAQLVRSILWFNPVVWWIERQLSLLAEHASDEACIHAAGDATRYADTLLQFAGAARHGHRWIGGVAMAQHKIARRIERVLAIRKAGPGILSRGGWAVLVLLLVPILYVSAAVKARTPAEIPGLSSVELVRVFQRQLPVPETVSIAALQQAKPTQTTEPAPAPVQPNGGNPDLVGEIHLILAPIETQAPQPGQVQIQTNSGTRKYSGNAIWNVQNPGLNPSRWGDNINWATTIDYVSYFTFALTEVRERTLLFQTRDGNSSYGCSDCSFKLYETGIGAASMNTGPGVLFHLNTEGKKIDITCQSAECSVIAAPSAKDGTTASRILKKDESITVDIPVSLAPPPVNTGLRCFSIFGNVKADGTPFTAADCPSVIAPSGITFIVHK